MSSVPLVDGVDCFKLQIEDHIWANWGSSDGEPNIDLWDVTCELEQELF